MNILELENPVKFSRGVAEISVRDGEWRLDRLTAEQRESLAARNAAWALRGRCNSGQVLVFRTDSPFVDIDLRVAGRVRPWFGLDVEVDGRMLRVVRIPQAPAVFAQRLLEFSAGDPACREIRIYLPQNLEVRLRSVTVADGAVVEPVPPAGAALLALGDSITQGMDVLSPANIYPLQLARLLGADLLNQGIGGHRFDPEFPPPPPETWANPAQSRWITLAWGVNDWNGGVAGPVLEKHVAGALAGIERTHGHLEIPVFVITPIWCAAADQERAAGTLEDFSRRLAEVVRQCLPAARIIDGRRLVPHSPEYFTDGLHPNDAGALLYALNLYRELASNMHSAK